MTGAPPTTPASPVQPPAPPPPPGDPAQRAAAAPGSDLGKLVILMITAFVDMVGLLMVIPLLPFYAKHLAGNGFMVAAFGAEYHLGIGQIVALLVSSYTVAQLLAAPMWGRFSDRWGRRPVLMVALFASALAYIVFAFANTLWLLLLSRLVQGAGGGTVGVIQAYVADATRPEDRAKSLGWLSAATNAGVALGPVLGSWTQHLGSAAPGLVAAALCLTNILFAWRYLRESHQPGAMASGLTPPAGTAVPPARPRTSRAAVARVVTHSAEPASRLIWIYAIAIGAFQGVTSLMALFLSDRFQVTADTIGYFFGYIGVLSVVTRALVLGKMVDRFGEARLSRIGLALLATGLAALPFARNYWHLAAAVGLMPLGTAFTFPCVTALLSRVISSRERGLYMGVQQTFGGLSRAIFPVVAGLAYDHIGIGVPFWLSAGLVAGTLLLGFDMESYAKAHTA